MKHMAKSDILSKSYNVMIEYMTYDTEGELVESNLQCRGSLQVGRIIEELMMERLTLEIHNSSCRLVTLYDRINHWGDSFSTETIECEFDNKEEMSNFIADLEELGLY